MTVYVRWYGKILEGELIEGESMGMKQVRIPLDGHHPVALFTPDHVYDTPDHVAEKFSINCQKSVEISQKPTEISKNQPNIAIINGKSVDLNDDALIGWIRFKYEHWDYEHNHLKTDALEEFYKVWRHQHSGTIVPYEHCMKYGYPVNEAEAPKRIVSDEQMEELKEKLKEALNKQPTSLPTQKPVSSKPSPKILRSTGQQKFNDSIQLSLFD